MKTKLYQMIRIICYLWIFRKQVHIMKNKTAEIVKISKCLTEADIE